MSLHSIDRLQGDAGIGHWTAPAARGRGLAAGVKHDELLWARIVDDPAPELG